MPKSDVTNTSAIFASNFLNSLGNARTLNGKTSDDFLQLNKDSAPLEDNKINLGSPTHRYKEIWTLNLNGIDVSLFPKRNKSYIPTLNDTFLLGDGTHRFKQVFSAEILTDKIITDQLYGSDNQAFSHTKLKDIGTNTHQQIDSHISAMTLVHGATDANVPNRIVSRDTNGNFSAGTIKAKLGDLAENYTSKDTNAPVGTVFCVSESKNYDVEICNEEFSTKVIGVISENPGFIMSEKIEGVTLGLKGKVPIRVIGPVKKGDMLASAGNGVAFTTSKPEFKFAVSLEENLDFNEKLVMGIL